MVQDLDDASGTIPASRAAGGLGRGHGAVQFRPRNR